MAPLGDFSAKVAQANDRIICGSSVDAVKTVPMGRILARRLRIPFFQRRYCWGEPQWARAAAADALREDDEFEFPAPAPRRPSPRAVSSVRNE